MHGAALAGKAAAGLQESSGILSRTLASWEQSWQAGQGSLEGQLKERASANREINDQTSDGRRGFAPADRIVLLEKKRDLGVTNGI